MTITHTHTHTLVTLVKRTNHPHRGELYAHFTMRSNFLDKVPVEDIKW